MALDLRAVRRRSTRRLHALDLPQPFTTAALADRLSVERDRPLHLIGWRGSLNGLCGVWIGADHGDYVFYDASITGVHRDHVIAHELAHIMWNHGSADTPAVEVLGPELIAALTPSLDPAVVRAMLARSTYTTTEEAEAEVLASLVMQRAANDEHTDRLRRSTSGDDASVGALAQSMGRRGRPS